MASAIRTEDLTKDYAVGFWRERPDRALDPLLQLISPPAGRAEILGRPVGDVRVRRRIGYLPENPYFYDYLTAEELLTYFASLFGYHEPERRRRVGALLDLMGLGGGGRLPLRKYSKGMLQRVGIAQAVLND